MPSTLIYNDNIILDIRFIGTIITIEREEIMTKYQVTITKTTVIDVDISKTKQEIIDSYDSAQDYAECEALETQDSYIDVDPPCSVNIIEESSTVNTKKL